ncbi:hypothetical protein [Campylobacter pinnipediorum]|uniref:hypothetical protein n=1 Tax=Campylobacter pinnipediorum TaxID=1965231 RepID=UPI00112FB641|nr:hypothetical protein [Campylobacter pinnipediorum]
MATLLKSYKKDNDVVFLFCNNSMGIVSTSSTDKSTHIIDILNYIKTDAYDVAHSDFIFSKDGLLLKTNEVDPPPHFFCLIKCIKSR